MKLSKITRYIVSGCLLLLAGSLFADSESQVVRRFGLFIGANNGGQDRPRLQWAISDAQRMNQVMGELGGLLPGDGLVMTEPSQLEIQQALARFRTQVASVQGDARRVEFMFYYSGHSDEEGLLLGKDRFAYRSLRQAITDVKADVTIAVLDSCASGAFTRQKGGVRVQPFLVDASNDMKGYAFLTSASENEAAQESDRLGASFFTHYLVSALRGAAATNGNGRVTLNEAYHYAFNETLARTEATTSGPQHPSYDINLSGTGDLVLSDLSQPSASLILKEDLEGRVFVRDAKGYLIAEVNKSAGKSTTLALQPGSYTLRIESPGGVYQAPARLQLHQQYAIGQANFQRAQLASNRTRGAAPVTAAPAAAQPPAAREGSLPSGDNVLEQARARYRRSQQNAIPDSGTGQPALAQPDQTAGQDGSQALDGNPTITIDLEGIGTWEFAPPVIKPPSIRLPAKKDVQPPRTKPAEEPASSQEPVTVGFHLSVLPGVGSVKSRDVTSSFTLSPLVASVSANTALMASLFVNLNSGQESGVQISSLLNTAGSLNGVQATSIGNLSARDSSGVQLSGLFNIASAKFDGVQAAGTFNVAKGDSRIVQIAGLFNTAESMTGVQAAALFNYAADAHGLVIAPVNIMGKFDGIPIGLVNLVGDGIHDISYWYDIGDRSWLGYLNGSKNFYSIFYAGVGDLLAIRELDGLAFGLGVGGRLRFSKEMFMDIEGSVKWASVGNTARERVSSLGGGKYDGSGIPGSLVPAIRLDGGVDFGFLKLFGGVNLDMFIKGMAQAEKYLGSSGMATVLRTDGNGAFSLRPGFFVGVSLSF